MGRGSRQVCAQGGGWFQPAGRQVLGATVARGKSALTGWGLGVSQCLDMGSRETESLGEAVGSGGVFLECIWPEAQDAGGASGRLRQACSATAPPMLGCNRGSHPGSRVLGARACAGDTCLASVGPPLQCGASQMCLRVCCVCCHPGAGASLGATVESDMHEFEGLRSRGCD